MSNPNELAPRLDISPIGAACGIQLSDRRHSRTPLERPVNVTLFGGAFEATFLASYEDMEKMRDWLNAAMAAIETKNAEAA